MKENNNRIADKVKIYWYSQDPENTGRTWSIFYSDEHEESGNMDDSDLSYVASPAELRQSLVNLLYSEGIEIGRGLITLDLADGRYVKWTRDT